MLELPSELISFGRGLMPAVSKGDVQVAEWQVRPQLYEIEWEGEIRPLEPEVMDILACPCLPSCRGPYQGMPDPGGAAAKIHAFRRFGLRRVS
jgi:hypothetical protein